MANNNKKEAAEAAASLKEKQNFLAALPETATDSERELAQKDVNEAQTLVDSFVSAPGKNAKKAETVKIEFTSSPTGKFLLAYNVGEKADFDVKQAAELIELGFAKEVKK